MSVAPIAGTSLPWLLLELSEETSQEPTANRGNGINNEGIGTALPCWLCDVGCFHCSNALAVVVLELTEGTESQRGNRNALALWLIVMVVVPFAATSLPWLFWNSQKGKSQEPQRRERNHNKGITTPLPCRFSFPKTSTVAGWLPFL